MDFGITEANCPIPSCRGYGLCYVECEHKEIIENAMVAKIFSDSQPFLRDIFDAVTSVQEEFIQCLCDELEVCQRAGFLNINCVQCVNTDIVLTGFHPDPFVNCFCGALTLCENCPPVIQWEGEQLVDLSTLPEFVPLLDFVECANGSVDVDMMNEYFAIFGGEILGVSNGCFQVRFVDLPTFPISAIESMAPRPLGGCFTFYN